MNSLLRELKYLEGITCEIERVPNLIYDLELTSLDVVVNPMLGDSKYRSVFGGEGFLPEGSFITSDCFILCKPSQSPIHLPPKNELTLAPTSPSEGPNAGSAPDHASTSSTAPRKCVPP